MTRALALIVALALPGCYRPELALTSSSRTTFSPTMMAYSLTMEGDRVLVRLPEAGRPERSGTLTADALRALGDALTHLEDEWDPPYDVRLLSSPTYTHRLLRDTTHPEVVIHEPLTEEYSREVRPLSDLTYAIELEAVACGGALVVLDAPPADCP